MTFSLFSPLFIVVVINSFTYIIGCFLEQGNVLWWRLIHFANDSQGGRDINV